MTRTTPRLRPGSPVPAFLRAEDKLVTIRRLYIELTAMTQLLRLSPPKKRDDLQARQDALLDAIGEALRP